MDAVGHAAGLAPSAREEYLRAALGDDAALLAEARSLLAQTDDGTPLSELIDRRIGVEAAQVAGLATSTPESIGPYTIVETLGEGGMGVVYGARQERPLRRDVAIKVVRAGLHAPRLLARFEAERRVLAAMDHPYIARVFDAGSTPEGLPYFVMEWVRGEPITQYCERKALSRDARLLLFSKVLGAVEYAHQRTVVHRDLKPANILVTEVDGVPTPKVIDFGVARIAAESNDEETLHTAVGAVIGTREYMSPEQASGDGSLVDTRADVYALGVLLYELLTDRLPFASDLLRRASPSEFERLLRDVEPPPARNHRAIPADLDNIVSTAMRKDRDARYASVSLLQEDLRRFLEGRPVRAHPATWQYRLGRFVSRRRSAVLGVSVAVLLLLGSALVFTLRLAEERDRAQAEAAKASQVAAFLRQLFDAADPGQAQGETVTARALLDAATARVDASLASQPDVQASLQRLLASVYQSLGELDRALPLAERAVATHRNLHGDVHEETASSRAALASLLVDRGEAEQAEPLTRAALDTRLRLFGPQDPRVAELLGDLATVRDRLGFRIEAESLYRTALDIQLAQYGPDAPEVATTKMRLGGVLRVDGRLRDAEPLLREALVVQRRLYGETHPRVASAMRNLAALLRDTEQYAASDSLYREVLAVRRRVLGNDHQEVATTLSSYGSLLREMGDSEGATAALTESVEILERVHGGAHPILASSTHNLALQLRASGRYDDAERWFRRAMAIQDTVLAPGHADRAYPRYELGAMMIERGKPREAERWLREALQIRRRALPAGHRRTAETLSELGLALMQQRRFGESEAALQEAYDAMVAAEGADAPRAKRVAERQAQLAQARGVKAP